jgi:hypothetical protein
VNGTSSVQLGKVLGGIVLGILWVLCFLYISPTLVIDFGAGFVMSFKLFCILVGLLIIIGYHIFYASSPGTTKLSLTAILTITWLSMIIFYPFKDPANEAAGAVGFFALIIGLAVCVLWVHFFSDEIA